MKLGIVGNGMIVKAALYALKDSEIACTALWARNKEKGNAFLGVNGIAQIYDDYAQFLQDDSYDTVYVGLPNMQHYLYTKQAILAGKHVIVEKPFTVTAEEAKELVALAKEHNVFLFEAIMCRYSANYEAIREKLKSLGPVRLVYSNYSQYSSRYDAYLRKEVLPALDPKSAGGALYDLNVYNIHTIVGLFGKPKQVFYMANIGFNGIDTSGILALDYGNFKAVCTAAKDSQSTSSTVLQGELGTITISSRPGIVKNVSFFDCKEKREEALDAAVEENPMYTEFTKIAQVLDTKDHTTADAWMEQTIAVMEVLEEARQSAGISFGE